MSYEELVEMIRSGLAIVEAQNGKAPTVVRMNQATYRTLLTGNEVIAHWDENRNTTYNTIFGLKISLLDALEDGKIILQDEGNIPW